jgi:hypothetical protein
MMGDDKGSMGIDDGFEIEGASGAAICSLLSTGSLDSSPSSGLAVAKYTFRSTPTVPVEGQ